MIVVVRLQGWEVSAPCTLPSGKLTFRVRVRHLSGSCSLSETVLEMHDGMGCHVWLCLLCPEQFQKASFMLKSVSNPDCEGYIPVLRYQDGLLCLEEVISTL